MITDNDTFRSYPSKIEEIYNQWSKVTEKGSVINLSPVRKGKMQFNGLYGDTLQDGTPTPDTPIEIQNVTGLQNIDITGKNLLNSSVITNSKITISEDGTLNVSNVGGANGYCETGKTLSQLCPDLKVGDIVYLYIDTDFYYNDSKRDLIYCRGNWTNGTSKTITQDMLNGIVVIYGGYQTTSHIKIMITKKLETTYEPYKGNTYEVNLGKNLLPNLVNTQTLNGMTITKNEDESLTFNGTANAGTNLNINYASGSYIHLESGKTYTASLTNNNGIYFRLAKVSGGNVVTFDTPNKQLTFTSNYTGDCFVYLTILNGTTFDNLTIYPQIELGDGTSYSPYFTPIELNKIGDYEDRIYKDNDKWYIEKKIGKAIVDGSTGSYSNTSTNRFNIDNLITDFKKSEGYNLSLSNYYKSFNQVGSNADFNTLVSNENYAFDFSSATSYTLRFKDTRYTNVNDFKTWLGTNNVSIIYVLATPTYTEITNTELINQLETLYTAKSYDNQTNISVNEDLPLIISASALMKGGI